MSLVVRRYPEPRYTKDTPETSAWIKRADEGPDYEFGGVDNHDLANQQATSSSYGLYRVEIVPAGGGPGPHSHRPMHGFRNQADEPASRLMLFAPGATREAYFEQLP